jgi:hypothetical protein
MTSRHFIRTIWLSLPLLLAMTAPAFGQAAVLDVSVRTIPRDGTPSRTRAWDTNELAKGQTDSTYLFAGSAPGTGIGPSTLPDGAEFLCSAGASEVNTASLDDLVSRHLHVWKIASRAAGATERGFAFDVAWVRYSNATGTRPVASGRSTLILAEGQRHVLDLVHATAASSQCDTGSVVLDVEARVQDDSPLADRAIRYDIWLVHTEPSGEKHTSHAVQTGLHGMLLPFAFSPVRLPVVSNATPQTAFDAAVRVNGHLRGRVRSDGAVIVELMTGRQASLEQRGARRVALPQASEGRKVLLLAPSETLAIELPALTGGATTVVNAGASGGGVSGRVGGTSVGAGRPSDVGAGGPSDVVSFANGKLTVSFTRLFEGHKLSIFIRAQVVE